MKKRTYYQIILDQSGSMEECLKRTISGFNEQMQMIKKMQKRFAEQEVLVGLTCFNDEVTHKYFGVDPENVAALNAEMYQPDGCTALYDAIGLTTKKLQNEIRERSNEDIAVVVVILTDGYENASQYYNLKQVRNLIKELESSGKWTFSYLGATLDAEEIAASLNIQKQNSMCFEIENIEETLSDLSSSMDSYLTKRRTGKISSDFLKSKD